MKKSVSIPDAVFAAAAEAASRSLGMSRSEFNTKAIQAFVNAHQSTGVTKLLNEVYAGEPSVLDPLLAQTQFAAIARADW